MKGTLATFIKISVQNYKLSDSEFSFPGIYMINILERILIYVHGYSEPQFI